MVDLNFGINNPITAKMIKEADFLRSTIGLIRGHFAIEDQDCQTMGIECACAVGMLFLAYLPSKNPKRKFEDSYTAINIAQNKVKENPYLLGFTHGWDGKGKDTIDSEEYEAGYTDGKIAVGHFDWVRQNLIKGGGLVFGR